MRTPNLAAHLEAFFTERLQRQRHASPNTVASYRDTFRLLLIFAKERLGLQPSRLKLRDLDGPLISSFLDHLEEARGNSIRTRNARLAAIRSFFRFVALEEPGHGGVIQRVLAIPNKRCQRSPVDFLTRREVEALLQTPDLKTWTGRRDRTLMLVAVQTGLRVSELIALRWADVHLGRGAHVRCVGKGRKERCTPLQPEAVELLAGWRKEEIGEPDAPVFRSRRGGRLSRDAVSALLSKHAEATACSCPSLTAKRVTPHVLRHTTAMDLLESGVDRSVIALWLGHERMETTQIYLHASLQLKERALERARPHGLAPMRYKPDDELLAFLEAL